jgi:mannose-6-phosphate isomerase-like protein (cupin superfamily)
MTVVSRASARHYNWGEGCDGWVILPNVDVSIIEERMPPSTSEARHFHEKARQFFYVLSGELEMEIDGHIYIVASGSGIEVPPRSKHQARNHGAGDVRFLVTSCPTTVGDRIECSSDKIEPRSS